MLNLLSTDCQGVNRREFLRLGSLAAGGLSLVDVLRQRAKAQDARNDTAVIQVFLCGGPSQHDTFDPKPLAPTECRPFDSIQTVLPGVRVTEFFPRLAAIFDEFSVVRSVAHGDGSHNHSVHWLQTGHWGNVFTALFAGGGLRHGQVIGSSDAKGAVPQDRPLGPTDLLATMYRFLDISTDLAPTDFTGRPIPLLPSGEPIREMFG